MRVRELIEKLQRMDSDATVLLVSSRYVDSGCSTCGGWDEDFETDVDEVVDLETKVHITPGEERKKR